MEKIQVRIVSRTAGPLPQYATEGAAGMDVRAALTEPMTIAPGQRALVPTGLSVELPAGFEMQLRPRSGLALKHGITLLNSPGTIDADYRGEIGVIMANFGAEPFVINNGDRICQAVVARYARVEWEAVDQLGETARGEGGFGHSGVK